MTTRECVVDKEGDTILEFANAALEIHPIRRFRVSSHLLSQHSPLFKRFLSAQNWSNNPLHHLERLCELPVTWKTFLGIGRLVV